MASDGPRDTTRRPVNGQDTKSARTRARILDAAANVLSLKGYSGMRLGDVAEAAGLQTPAIYYHFDSREHLVEEVMWAGMAAMRLHLIEVLDALPAGATALERLLAAVEAHLRYELEISDYTTASIHNAGQVPEENRQRMLAEQASYGAVWRDLIDRAAELGEVRSDYDRFIVQMLIIGALNWAVEWWDPNRATIDEVVQNARTFVQRALCG